MPARVSRAVEVVALHSYLSTSLVLMALCLAGLWLAPRHRKAALTSAMASAPTAVYALLFVPAYWNPVEVISLPVAVEDLLFSFANGGLVWLLVAAASPPMTQTIDGAAVVRRWLGMTALFLPLLLVLSRAGLPVMQAGLLAAAAVCGFLLRRRPAHWRLAARGAVTFGALYAAVLWATFRIWPDALSQWNLTALSGVRLAGAPVEEFIWAVAFGGGWSVFMGYALDARLQTTNTPPAGERSRS